MALLLRRLTGGLPTEGWDSRAVLVEMLAAIKAAEKRMEEKAADREQMAEEHKAQIIARMVVVKAKMIVSRTWRDRLLGAGAGATLTIVALWLVLVSAAAAAVIVRT